MELVSKPKLVECLANDQLWACILATYTPHDGASDFRIFGFNQFWLMRSNRRPNPDGRRDPNHLHWHTWPAAAPRAT